MIYELERLSVRTATWIAAQCVRHFCSKSGIDDPRLFEYIDFLEELPLAGDVPAWDQSGSALEVSGLGDPLPAVLQDIPNLLELVDASREVSAYQIFGRFQPAKMAEFLRSALALSDFEIAVSVNMEDVLRHDPGRDGWGQPVEVAIRDSWARLA